MTQTPYQFAQMVAGLSVSDEPDAPFSEPATDAIESMDNLVTMARAIVRESTEPPQPQPGQVSLRDSGGVHVYYALPVLGGDTGVFEHISTWPRRNAAEAAIRDLEAADARRSQLATDARESIQRWREAAEGFSGDDEYEAASEVADSLEAILTELTAESLILPGVSLIVPSSQEDEENN